MNSSNGSSSNNVLHNAFLDMGMVGSLVLIFSVKVLIAVVCTVLNAALIWVTIMENNFRSLHTNCNVLIAFFAALVIPNQLNFLVPFSVVTFASNGRNFIPLRNCFFWQSVSVLCCMSSFAANFFIGVDRLLAVLFPLWYRNRKTEPFLIASVSLCLAFGSFCVYLDANVSFANPELLVMCVISDPAQHIASGINMACMVLTVATVACYVIIAVVMFAKHELTPKKDKQLFKSLALILAVEVCGSFANSILRFALGAYNVSTLQMWYIANWAHLILYIGLALNTPILYICSADYNRFFKKHLCFKNTDDIDTVPPVFAQQHAPITHNATN